MLTFSQLPDDILYLLIQAVPIDDLEAFTSTCKAVHELAHLTLKRHRSLKRYTVISLFQRRKRLGPSFDDRHDPVLLLGSILDNPEIRHYVRTLKIGRCNTPESLENGLPQAQKHEVAIKFSTNFDTIARRFDLNVWKDYDFLRFPCQIDAATVAINLLCLLLTNLKSIISEVLATHIIMKTVRAIAEANWDQNSQRHGKALTHLESFSERNDPTLLGASMAPSESFALLPSLRIFKVQNLVSPVNNWSRTWQAMAPALNITELQFSYCAIGVFVFQNLLARVAGLKKFCYIYNPSDGYAPYDPGAIANLLGKNAAHSLENLLIHADYRRLPSSEAHEQYVGSLESSKVLKYIALPAKAFEIPRRSQDSQTVENGKPNESEGVQQGSNSQGSIVDLLPRSIERLFFTQGKKIPQLTGMLEVFVDQKHRLPVLNSLVFANRNPLTEDTANKMKDAGIKVEIMHSKYDRGMTSATP